MAELFDLLSDDVGGTDIINTLNTATKSPPKISTDTEKKSMLDRFDRPIPGQSMTSELGNAKYEQPPQYTELSEFMDFLFKRMNSPKIYRDIMRLLDAGVPVRSLTGPVLMQAQSEGKINMDLAMLAAEPLATMLGGMGEVAGIDVVRDGRPEEPGLDTRSLKEAFKSNRKQAESPEIPDLENSLVTRREPNE